MSGEVHLLISKLRVSLVPPDDPEADLWQVTVEWVGGDRYAVRWLGYCLADDDAPINTWDYEPIPSERGEAFKVAHRFDFETAKRRAAEACQYIVVNGVSVSEYLARKGGGS